MGDVNVALFKFGAGVPDTTSFLPNVAIADHLAGVKKRWEETDPNKHIPECVWGGRWLLAGACMRRVMARGMACVEAAARRG